MKIALLVPPDAARRSGNGVTAWRWAGHWRALGHRVWIDAQGGHRPADLVVALHAHKSARAVQRQRRLQPSVPVIVGLAGTDLYRDLSRSAAMQEVFSLIERIAHTDVPVLITGERGNLRPRPPERGPGPPGPRAHPIAP